MLHLSPEAGLENVSLTPATTGSLKNCLFLFIVFLGSVFCADVTSAQTIAAWSPAGVSGPGPSPWSATTTAANTTIGGLTRGSGLGTGATAGSAWGASAWLGTSEAASISGNYFATFTIKANPGYSVSLSSLSLFYRRSGTGPATGQLQYSVDGTTFINVTGGAFSYASTSSSGAALPPVSLSGITDLQSVPSATTITFRIVNWGGGSSGTWYVFGSGLSVSGTVNVASGCSGTPLAGTAATSVASACGSGTTVLTLTGGSVGTGLTYQWSSSTGGAYSDIAGATQSTYTTPAVSATTFYEVTTTCTSSSLSNTSSAATLTIDPLPSVISGPTAVCMGSTITAGNDTSGGAWSSSNAAAATIGSGTGIISGLAAGSTIISYTRPSGCFTTRQIAVHAPVAGPVVSPSVTAVCANGPAALLTATRGTYASAVTFSSGNINLNAGASATAFPSSLAVSGIPAGATITAVSVNVNFTTSYVHDYIFNLKSPNGNILNLIGQHNPSGAGNYTNTTISSSSTNSLNSGGSPYTGTFMADAGSPLGGGGYTSNTTVWSALYSVPNGAWTLAPYNTYTGAPDVSTFNSWSITVYFTLDGTTTCSPTSGLFTDAAATTPYTGTTADSVYALPSSLSTITATSSDGACSATAVATVTVNPAPASIDGVLAVCPGLTTALSDTSSGGTWSSSNSSIADVNPLSGIVTGMASGNATITYTLPTTCMVTAPATVNVMPTVYNVTGGGGYCAGGTGVHIGLTNSAVGVNYQLFNGATVAGAAVAGIASPLDFGLHPDTGTYTVVATDTATTCVNNMNDSAVVTILPLPNLYAITGGGSYCQGGTGVSVGLGSSDAGFSYQLINNNSSAGAPLAGSGTLDFGLQTSAGSYIITATDNTTHCADTMSGTDTVTILPLPAVHTVTGGGGYCAGTSGTSIGLNTSDVGFDYQLYFGASAIGSSFSGTGSSLDFGLQTSVGGYTVVATNTATTCADTMGAGVSIFINPLPNTHLLIGGGHYCSGGTGIDIGLNGSDAGISYQLFNGSSTTGSPLPGTGSTLNFGFKTDAGSYTITATDISTHCENNMSGIVPVVIDPLPVQYPVTGGGGYCIGGTGVNVGLSSSDAGISYQLFSGSSAIGAAIPGTGASLDFGRHTAAGNYVVIATNTSTSCVGQMAGHASVAIDLLPIPYPVTGGGHYCNGGAGRNIGLALSENNVSYQLMYAGAPTGSALPGGTAALDFGPQTSAGTYIVLATNTLTGCVKTMTGAVTILIDPLPTTYSTTGGGSYCAGGAGIHIGLAGSDVGTRYQLTLGSSPLLPFLAGSGSGLDFGAQTASGNYTIEATNTATGCTTAMGGISTILVNALPAVEAVSGGGSYCIGGTGVHIGLGGSESGISYQLYHAGSAAGSPVSGTGASVDFGLQTAPGAYAVTAFNTATTCANNMGGLATINLNALPNAFNVIGGGIYCTGGAGSAISLDGSMPGISYQLYNGASLSGAALPGTNDTLNFGPQTDTGTYTVVATNSTTGCIRTMNNIATVSVHAVAPSSVSLSSAPSATVCSGTHVSLSAATVNGGSTPIYNWTLNGITVAATDSSYNFVPTDSNLVVVKLTSGDPCASPAITMDTVLMHVIPYSTPVVSISSPSGDTVCHGTSVTFSAAPTFGGSAPAYKWYKNLALADSGTSYSFAPANSDYVYCTMKTNYICPDTAYAISNYISMTVTPAITPTVSIAGHPGVNTYKGMPDTLTASVTGGSSLHYQWYLNGVAVPAATSATFIRNSFADHDSVTCAVTSTDPCVTGASASALINVSTVGVHDPAQTAAIALVPNPNNGRFTLSGTLGNNSDEQVTVTITNMLGQLVNTKLVPVHNGNIDQLLDLKLTSGIYTVTVHSFGGDTQLKMVVN